MAQGRNIDKINLKDLPEDVLLRALPPFLEPQLLGRLPRLSHHWHTFFLSHENPFRINLICQFDVKNEELLPFERLKKEGKIAFRYQDLYRRYYQLLARIKRLKLKNIPLNDEYRPFLLASCINHPFILRWIPSEMRTSLISWTLYAGSAVMDENTLKELSTLDLIKLAEEAAKVGNFLFLSGLLELREQPNFPQFEPTETMLSAVIEAGETALANKLFALKNNNDIPILFPRFRMILSTVRANKNERSKSLLPDISTLKAAIVSRNATLASKLLAIKDESGYPRLADNTVFNLLIEFDFVKEFRELLALTNSSGQATFMPTEETLNATIKADNLEVFRELISRGLLPTANSLKVSIILKRTKIYREIIALKNTQGLPVCLPTLAHLTSALHSANEEAAFELLEQLSSEIKEKNYYQAIIVLAARSENIAFFRRILAFIRSHYLPTNSIIEELVPEATPAILHELLMLRDKQGKRVLAPSPLTLNHAIDNENMDLILELLSHHENGWPLLMPTNEHLDLAIYQNNEIMQVLKSYRLMYLALSSFIINKNFDEAVTRLKDAYSASAFIFFREIENISRSLDSKALECLKNFVATLWQSELNHPKTPRWAIEKFEALQKGLGVTNQNDKDFFISKEQHQSRL